MGLEFIFCNSFVSKTKAKKLQASREIIGKERRIYALFAAKKGS